MALRFQGSFFCGGSIIAAKWIVTAAHCFKFSTKAQDWRFKAGATNYVTTGVWSDVDRIIVHEKYNSTSNENDIALVKNEDGNQEFAVSAGHCIAIRIPDHSYQPAIGGNRLGCDTRGRGRI